MGKVRPASVGVIIGFRPFVQVVVSFNHREFDRVWSFAMSGRLKYVHLVFTKPDYNSALVTNVAFSTEQEE